MTLAAGSKTWIQTFTGAAFWPLAPHASDVNELDVAHALSNVCRFTGHCRDFYSVAQHSVHVSEFLELKGAPPEVVLAGLLHDAAEAYIADIAAPIKRSGEFGTYRTIERTLDRCIEQAFGLPPFVMADGRIKEADLAMLHREALDLMSPLAPGWGLEKLPPPAPWNISPWIPSHAKDQFLKRLAWCRAQCSTTGSDGKGR